MEKNNDFVRINTYKKLVRKVNQTNWKYQKEKDELAGKIAELDKKVDQLNGKLDTILKTLGVMQRKTEEEFGTTQTHINKAVKDVSNEVRNRSVESQQTLDSSVELLKLLLANQLMDDMQSIPDRLFG